MSLLRWQKSLIATVDFSPGHRGLGMIQPDASDVFSLLSECFWRLLETIAMGVISINCDRHKKIDVGACKGGIDDFNIKREQSWPT